MVYRGKLSKSCAECRAKKTRCDTVRPSCGQCRRASRKCSGYRDLQELRLLDQSSEVMSKLRGSSSQSSSESRSSPSSSSIELMTLTAFPATEFWIEGNARIAFFAQYVNVTSRNPVVKTELGFVPYVYEDSCSHGMLESIVSALGMAVLRQKNGNDLAFDRLASKKYSNALQLTQRALQNSKSARSDEALATVLLLGIHELVIMDRPRCESSRISVHLIGAIKLLQLRGVEQMNYAWGRMMVLRTFTEIMTSCLYHRWPVPASIMDFQRSIRHTMHPEEMAVANLMEIAARLCNVLYRPVVDKTSEMLEALVAIDEDLDGWAQKSVTPRLSFERVPIENPDKSFLTYWDSYSNHISGLVWNTYRCMLILLNERLLSMSQDWAAGLEAKNQAYYAQRAPSRIAELCEGICRSVPFFLGEEGSTHAWLEESQEPPTMYGGMAMLIPLCVAADCKQVSPPVHSWLVHQISRLARDTRIAGAQAFLKRLRDESSQGVGP